MLLTFLLYYLDGDDNSFLKSVEKQEKRESWRSKHLMARRKKPFWIDTENVLQKVVAEGFLRQGDALMKAVEELTQWRPSDKP